MWEALVGVLVGGAISALVQLVVTPRVAARLRAEERWEGAVVELHQELTSTTPRLAQDLTTAWMLLWSIQEDAAEQGVRLDEEPARSHFRALENEFIAAGDQWSMHRDRVLLLMRRLNLDVLAPGRMWPVVSAALDVRSPPRFSGETAEQVEAADAEEKKHRATLLEEVSVMLGELDERRNQRWWKVRG